MINIHELELGSNDAEDYKRKELKNFFNTVFCKNIYLDRLLTMNTFFLIGEKGTGKTAYAVFLSNNEYKETRSIIKYIRETQYQKFITLKTEKHLLLSDYVSIWRVIILVLMASSIKIDNISNPFSKNEKFEKIKMAIDGYFNNAFSPEIATAMQIVENSKEIASLIFNVLNYQAQESNQLTFTETKFQTNLQFIERNLLNSIMNLKMKNNQFLFIDGIDIRPTGIEYKEYLSCVKGLAEAIWALNNDDFSVSNGSKGRFKVVLLIRPDIFQSIGLQNSTNKIMNNSVYLDWRTTYSEYQNSELFTIGEKLLSYKQDCQGKKRGEIWDYYFNWTTPSTNEKRECDTPFIQFLRISYSRPRDIVTIVQYMQRIQEQKRPGSETFLPEIFESNAFKNAYSEYLMGGVKDQLAFYYTDSDYQLLMYFLSLFKNNSRFNYNFYTEKYKHFTEYVLKNARDNSLPELIDTEEMFLQFLYETNIICYIDEGEKEPLFRYCYRERNISNLTPKVEYGKKYEFHYGLIKALNLAPYK